MTIAQPVLLQSLDHEFNLLGTKTVTPSPAGIIYKKGKEKELIYAAEQKTHRSGIGNLTHVTRWSRPMELNDVREVSRFVQDSTKD